MLTIIGTGRQLSVRDEGLPSKRGGMRADRSGLEWPSRCCNALQQSGTIERGSTARRGNLHQSETSRPQPSSHERRNRPQLAPPTPSLSPASRLPGAALSLCKFGPAGDGAVEETGFWGGADRVGAGFDSHKVNAFGLMLHHLVPAMHQSVSMPSCELKAKLSITPCPWRRGPFD